MGRWLTLIGCENKGFTLGSMCPKNPEEGSGESRRGPEESRRVFGLECVTRVTKVTITRVFIYNYFYLIINIIYRKKYIIYII